MIKVGLTGGIGSGKSFIAEVFVNLGIPVFNSDIKARKISNTNLTIKQDIISHFGKESYHNDSLNRTYIAGMVFEKPELLEKLNSIIHPQLEIEFDKWLSSQNESKYVIKEAAILFETGGYKRMDSNILVIAPVDLRIDRIQKRDNLSVNQIKNRMANQWADERKEELADFIINNDENNLILPQIINIHKRLTESLSI